MDAKKRSKLKRMGGRVTTVKRFLKLTKDEAAIVELRLQLAEAVRHKRLARGLSQAALAESIGSSQARVAKIEGGDPQASLESMVRALMAAGGRVTLRVA